MTTFPSIGKKLHTTSRGGLKLKILVEIKKLGTIEEEKFILII
jgi:hypothetical protein